MTINCFQKIVTGRKVGLVLLFIRIISHAAIVGPYTVDSNTLHLWHLDGSVPIPDAVSSGGTNLTTLANGANLGAASYSASFGTCLSALDGGQGGVGATDKDAYLAASPTTVNVVMTLADPVTGAFTYEALVWIGFDPTKNFGTVPNGGNGRASVCEIITGEGTANSNRVFQFRIAPINTANANPAVNLEFVNVNLGSSQNMNVPVPTTGPDAIASNTWYHAAVTYNGIPNAANNITFYWTAMDPTRTTANAIGTATMVHNLPVTSTVLAIGNLAGRSPIANNFLGLVDEVRVSNVPRAANGMMFSDAILSCTHQGNALNLIWPVSDPSFSLQFRTKVNSGSWTTLSNASVVSGHFSVNEPLTNATRFYRLIGIAPPDTVDKRKAATVNAAYVTPWPDTNANPADDSGEFIGKSAYALTAYYLHANLATADEFINALHDTSYLGVQDSAHYQDTSTDDLEYEFSLPLLIRIGLGNNTNGTPMVSTMSAQARTNLLDMIWCAIHSRSKTNDASSDMSDVWGVLGSENHNAVWRSTFFLGAQLLNGAGPPYGPGNSRNTLLNGGTLAQHYNAWLAYWLEYFRQRAREGISMEARSPTYEKYTLAGYYDVMDFGGTGGDRAVMQSQASQFLTLFWADMANDFCVGATIPGGAGCRMYQTDSLTDGTTFSLREWLYMYDWHDTNPSGTAHPEILTAAMSPFKLPQVVNAIATNLNKAPYEYNSHRLGAGTDDTYGDTDFYHLSTPTYVRRDTQWTSEFVMGSMTYDTTKSYTLDTGENQFCGVIFKSSVTNRLIVQGIGTAKSGLADTRGVTSASNKQTLIAALGTDNKNNNGMRVFVSNLLFNNMLTNGNWLFTFSQNAYAAIRIATGGYTWVTTNNDGGICMDGEYLKLNDRWSPLVIQCGLASDYSTNRSSFTNAVLTTTYFNYDSVNGVMTYTNLMGQQFKMWRESDNLPWVGPGPRSQNPSYLYQSPYLNADYGSSTVTISYPGFFDLVLNFDY